MSLLPASSGRFERAFEESHSGRWAAMWAAVPYITTMKDNPPPAALPFLVYEFGIGMLTPYVSNLYELLDGRGVRWLRVRGTYEAIDRGLQFLGLTATMEPAWHGRVWWNSAQLRFPALPANDVPLLGRIEGITRLSLPKRSDLRRGVHEYDVGPAIGDHSRWDSCMLEHESGVRLHDGGTIWSFGRTHEFDHALDREECLAAGVWIEPDWSIEEDASPYWTSLEMLWTDADFLWSVGGAREVREQAMTLQLAAQSMYLVLRDADGGVIGYRRTRAVYQVRRAFGGPYRLGDQSYTPSQPSALLYVEAMTDFDDIDGIEGGTVGLAVGGTLGAGVKPGALWLEPDELADPAEIAVHQMPVPLRRTVRERVKFLLRFADPIPPNALTSVGSEPNAFALDFTDDSFAWRFTTKAELALRGEAGLALDFTDDSYAVRT